MRWRPAALAAFSRAIIGLPVGLSIGLVQLAIRRVQAREPDGDQQGRGPKAILRWWSSLVSCDGGRRRNRARSDETGAARKRGRDRGGGGDAVYGFGQWWTPSNTMVKLRKAARVAPGNGGESERRCGRGPLSIHRGSSLPTLAVAAEAANSVAGD